MNELVEYVVQYQKWSKLKWNKFYGTDKNKKIDKLSRMKIINKCNKTV